MANQSYRRLDEHIQLLADRGYTSEAFGTLLRKEKMEWSFRAKYARAVIGAYEIKDRTDFMHRLKGHFKGSKGEQDQMNIRLHYWFDPLLDKLTLNSMGVDMGEQKRIILLSDSAQLKPARDIYASLAAERELKQQETRIADLRRIIEAPGQKYGVSQKGL